MLLVVGVVCVYGQRVRRALDHDLPIDARKNAKSQKDEVEAFLETNLSGVVPLDDVKVDGLFVIATATIEEGAWEEVAERLPF